jgi:hypothetical protein
MLPQYYFSTQSTPVSFQARSLAELMPASQTFCVSKASLKVGWQIVKSIHFRNVYCILLKESKTNKNSMEKNHKVRYAYFKEGNIRL